MKHVKAIKEELLSYHKYDEALDAIDELLEFAPHNFEALKIKAQILEAQGRFTESIKVWSKVWELNPDDPDALAFMHRLYVEEEEKLFFSEELENKNYVFFIYPRSLVRASIIGLIGCISFLFLVSKINIFYKFFADIKIMLISFTFLVLLPWILILWSYFKSVHYILLNLWGIKFVGRLKSYFYRWEEIEKMGLYYDLTLQNPSLDLIIIPKDETKETIMIDFNYESSCLKARYHFINILELLGHPLTTAPQNSLNLSDKKIKKI